MEVYTRKPMDILSGKIISEFVKSYDHIAEALALEYQMVQWFNDEELSEHFRRKKQIIDLIELTSITPPYTVANTIADYKATQLLGSQYDKKQNEPTN
jgi:ribosome-binding protein aMBF1 (putative translation factor)